MDLVQRLFGADRPNPIWVADITLVATWSGFAYVASVTDVFAHRIVGWRVARSMRTDLAPDALQQAIWARGGPHGVIHHSDRGSQHPSIRYTERLADAGLESSVGSKGDSYDNALAETINGPEVIHKRGPWRRVDEVKTRPWNGSTGSTTACSWSPSVTSRRRSWKWRTIANWKSRLWWPDPN